tara:strand:+ start:1588 stop:2064 length:477 start_codon:yes stop_codon:yes gene_type:complete
MNNVIKIVLTLIGLSATTDELVQDFKSPSFSGVGTSAHYLTIENQEKSRRDTIQEDIASELRAIEREADNTTVARFLRNLESRIFANLSKQLVDNMFDDDIINDYGSFVLEDNVVEYQRTICTENMDCTVGEMVLVLTITDSEGSVTTITIPVGTGGF